MSRKTRKQWARAAAAIMNSGLGVSLDLEPFDDRPGDESAQERRPPAYGPVDRDLAALCGSADVLEPALQSVEIIRRGSPAGHEIDAEQAPPVEADSLPVVEAPTVAIDWLRCGAALFARDFIPTAIADGQVAECAVRAFFAGLGQPVPETTQGVLEAIFRPVGQSSGETIEQRIDSAVERLLREDRIARQLQRERQAKQDSMN